MTNRPLCVLMAFFVSGCGPGLVGSGSSPSEAAASDLVGKNGLSLNGLSLNGLSLNGLSLNGLSLNGLSLNGLSLNGLSLNGLSLNGLSLNGLSLNGAFSSWFNNPLYVDQATGVPETAAVMTYIVRCALPATGHVDYRDAKGNTWGWNGQLGLAPKWATGKASVADQEWVTACLLSHVNGATSRGNAVHVSISVRSPNAEQRTILGTAATTVISGTTLETTVYAFPEAGFWGNLFTSPAVARACDNRLGSSVNSPTMFNNGRWCGTTGNCGISVVGTCGSVDPANAQRPTGIASATGYTRVISSFLKSPVCGDGECNAYVETPLNCSADCH